MKKTKILLFLFVALTLLVSACGGAAKTTEAPATEAPATEAPATEQPGTAQPLEEGPVEIVYWSLWNEGEPQVEVLKKWMDGYTQLHPNVTFNVTWAGREILTKVQTALSGGERIDLIDHEGPAIRGALVVKGLTLPLDQYLDMDAYDGGGKFRDLFIPGSLEALAAPDGSIHVVPYTIITTGFFTNKDILNKAGVTTDPETWDEFVTDLQKIQDSGVTPIAQDGQIDFYNAMWYYTLVQRLKGTGFLKAAAEDKSGEAWGDPAFLQAAKMSREPWEKGYIPEASKGYVWPAGQLELAVGNAAMELVGSWLPNEVKDTAGPDFNWGFFPLPNVEGGAGKRTDMEIYPLGWAIMKDAKNPDVIGDFIRFSFKKENAQMIPDVAVNMSAHKYTTPPEDLAEAWQYWSNATSYYLPYDGINSEYPDYYKNTFLLHFQKMFIGEITPEKFIENMKKGTADYWASQ
jgi:raffinose/stachyose/melibiose transport system substrate-binding protein